MRKDKSTTIRIPQWKHSIIEQLSKVSKSINHSTIYECGFDHFIIENQDKLPKPLLAETISNLKLELASRSQDIAHLEKLLRECSPTNGDTPAPVSSCRLNWILVKEIETGERRKILEDAFDPDHYVKVNA